MEIGAPALAPGEVSRRPWQKTVGVVVTVLALTTPFIYGALGQLGIGESWPR